MNDILVFGPYLVIVLILSIFFVVFSSIRWKLHPFLSLVLSGFIYGLGANWIGFIFEQPKPLIPQVVDTFAKGFGSLLSGIGLVIVFGTLLGKVLEKSGATQVMAHLILKRTGVQRAPLAMSVIGWIVSIPVFCDSGFILLSSLKKSLARLSHFPLSILSIALATGLYASHTFVPPTPGPLIAAANIGLPTNQLVWLLVFGGFVSLIAMLAGLIWSTYFVGKFSVDKALPKSAEYSEKKDFVQETFTFGARLCFLPLLLPLLLIALNSVANVPVGDGSAKLITGFPSSVISFLGHPVIALLVGFALATILLVKEGAQKKSDWIQEALKESALILLITGAGGGFGAVIKASPMANYLQVLLGNESAHPLVGLWILFVVAALLKTAQGSSTAALVIASSLGASLIGPMGLGFVEGQWIPFGPVLSILAIGAGAMVVSHVNDSYFWVVTQFSEMTTAQGYRTQTVASFLQGVSAMIAVTILGLIFL